MLEFAKRNVIVFIYSVLILSTLLVFRQVCSFDFTNYDDNLYVSDNQHVLNGLTKDSIIWAFTSTPQIGNWLPLTWLSFMLDCQLFGTNPGWMHFVNLLLHIANTLLLFAVLKKMTDSTPSTSSGQTSSPQAGALWPSAFVAAAFALHPMHVESVAWITERKDVLSMLFLLLTLAAYVGYVRRGGLFRYLLTVLLFVFGLLAKPMLVTLPFLLLLLDYWPLDRFAAPRAVKAADISERRRILYRIINEKIPFFAIAAVSSVVTFIVQKGSGSVPDINTLSLESRVANVFLSYTRYIGKMFWPQNLAVFYPRDIDKFSFWQIILCVLLLLVIFFLVFWFGRKRKYLPVGWLWFMGTLIPVIGLVQSGDQAYADRYTYISYIGLFIIIAWGLPELLSKWRYQKLTIGISMAIVLTTLGICAYRQVSYWKDSFTLFTHALEATQNNYVAHVGLGLGNDLLEHGNTALAIEHYTKAIEHYKKAIEIKPDYADVYGNIGIAYGRLGRYQEAIEASKQAIKLKPDYAEAYCNLGNVYGNLGRYEEAIEGFRQAIRLNPDLAEAHYNLGNVYLNLGRYQDAAEAYKQAIKTKPDLLEAHCNLGAIYLNLGCYQDAAEAYKQAIKIKPDLAEAYYNLGNAYLNLGRLQDAIEAFRQTIRIKPDFAKAYNNLGIVFGNLGRLQEAIESFRHAIRIQPDFADAHCNLGNAYLLSGDKDSAIAEYQILKTMDAEQANKLFNLIYK